MAKENFPINGRIKELIDYFSITRYRFSKETGISEVVLKNIFSGLNKPSVDALEKIFTRYKSVDANWLIMGEGSMFKKESLSSPEPDYVSTRDSSRLIELVDRLNAQNEELQTQNGKLRDRIDCIEQAKIDELEKKLFRYERDENSSKPISA